MEDILFSDLKNTVLSAVNPKTFYEREIGSRATFDKPILCVFHDDKKPSLKLNENGTWICYSPKCKSNASKDGAKGLISFYALLHNVPYPRAIWELFRDYKEFLLEESVIDLQAKQLLECEDVYEHIVKERGWRRDIIEILKIGLTLPTNRISIPIRNEYGFCNSVVYYNVFKNEKYHKTVFQQPGLVIGRVYPLGIAHNAEKLILCAGYADTICLLSHGLNGITIGSEGYKIKPEDLYLLKDKKIAICYDMDEAGEKGSLKIANYLCEKGICESVKIVKMPFSSGESKDITDWFVKEKRTTNELVDIIRKTEPHKYDVMVSLSAKVVRNEQFEDLPYIRFEDIIKAEHYNKTIKTEAEVIGKSSYYSTASRKIKIKCKSAKSKCGKCPLRKAIGHEQVIEFSPHDSNILRVSEEGRKSIILAIKEMYGYSLGCKIDYEEISTYTVTKVLLAPVVKYKTETKTIEQMQVVGYLFDHNIVPNAQYLLKGYATSHPRDGQIVAVFIEAIEINTSVRNFEITREVVDQLKPFRISKDLNFREHFERFYNHMGDAITGIRGRPWIHMGLDLAFHGVKQFTFNGQFVRKAGLDVIVFGDQQCGKGMIAQGLHWFYEWGEVISGENVSFFNLVGGIKILKTFRGPVFGRLVMNSDSTVIVDEVSSMDIELIGRLSRIRSEGFAEIDKDAAHVKADALCNLIWISNTRDRRQMHTFSHGIIALQHLIQAPEDIARFTYAMAVATEDVPTEIVNMRVKDVPRFMFEKEQCHNLILWGRSRTPEQIRFTDNAIDLILRASTEYCGTYSSQIPLIQQENIRIKIAKIAAAVAVRIFNTDDTYENLVIDGTCVKIALMFIDIIYKEPNLDYWQYSQLQKSMEKIKDAAIRKTLHHYANQSQLDIKHFLTMILQEEYITLMDIQAMLNLKREDAGALLSKLAIGHCIKRVRGAYAKTKPFTNLIKQMMRENVKMLYDEKEDVPPF